MAVSQELIDILVCPKCKGRLVLTPDNESLDCRACKVRYRIEDGIPVLLIDEAAPID